MIGIEDQHIGWTARVFVRASSRIYLFLCKYIYIHLHCEKLDDFSIQYIYDACSRHKPVSILHYPPTLQRFRRIAVTPEFAWWFLVKPSPCCNNLSSWMI